MSTKLEPISVRTTRLNHLILGNSKATSKASKPTADALSRDGLLDAFCLLYNECDKEQLKKRDKNINEFITKYRPIIEVTNSLRINNDDFSIKTIIGKGYFGNVHLVTEKTTGDVYAMKKIKKSVITTSQVKEERDIMAKRNSEWITNLQYAFQDFECLYLVMEYLPGGDLLSLMIRNGAFEEDLAKFYLAELTLAINDLHEMGYVHRDIKPENILIDRFGHIKLADFGNAAALNKDGHVMSLSPVGTPDYIAPELLQTISTFKLSKSTHDVTCDFWSMGIIGYELCCETTPFHEENVHETYSKILTHCEDSHSKEMISFPTDVKLSDKFKNFIQRLITKPTKRLGYSQIRKHAFFDGVKWDTLRQQVPPIIPNVNGDDDVSNFEDVERNKGRHSTLLKKTAITTNIKSNEFSGKDLPFLGYGFVHHHNNEEENLKKSDDIKLTKLNTKIKDMQIVMKSQTDEIRCLQENLIKAEQKAKQSDSVSKILTDAKKELNIMKESLKQKTIELASSKTEIKTLQNSLKIDEEMRLKNDDTISEILRSTYKKWENAKTSSDQNYEKQIAEKKTEITNMTQKLKQRENELCAKSEECQHLQDKLDNYKEMLKSIKDQALIDKQEFEKNKTQLADAYEIKLIETKNKLKMEKDTKNRLTFQLRDVQTELDESICSTNSNKQAKLNTEKNIQEIKDRLSREIELNNVLRSENAKIEKIRTDIEKSCENFRIENDKLQKELQILECTKNLKLSASTFSSPYQTAHGSLTELHLVEEQLRNDLATSKENEDAHRKRADTLEKAVGKLEEMIAKLSEQPKTVGDMLEKQNEKLENNLATAREQMVLERQSARTANLSLWKLEKQIDDLKHEKNMVQRRMNLTEEKMKKQQNDRSEIERSLKDVQSDCKQKDLRIKELREEISSLKFDNQKEHKMWEKAEQERMKEKSEVLEQVSKVHKLDEKSEELRQKLFQTQKKNDSLSLENNRLLRELNEIRDQASSSTDSLTEIQIKLKSTEYNFQALKDACNITETQLTEIEEMLEAEMKRNKTNQQKIEDLYKSIREKDEKIATLQKDVNIGVTNKIQNEEKMKNLNNEVDELRRNLENSQMKTITQQNQLIKNTNELFEAQEKIELLTSESNNLQTMTNNAVKEINILKEEGTRVLTELFLSKEEESNLQQELKESNQIIIELKTEIEQLNGTLTEQKNHFTQREIKSEATLAQHKKLIDYLQVKVEDLSLKKKKSFADMIFGSGTVNSKKENISPNTVESSILYRTLQEELKREKQKNKTLQEQLHKFQSIETQTNFVRDERTQSLKVTSDSTDFHKNESNNKMHTMPKRTENARISTSSSVSNSRRRTYQTHRFELTLETTESTAMICIACHKPVVIGSPYFKCKECKCCAHRKCRGDVHTSCEGIETVYEPPEKEHEVIKSIDTVDAEVINNIKKGYHGDFICKAIDQNNISMEINCAYEISENIILLGSNSGLFAYHRDSKTIVNISGIESVNYIAVTVALSKAILVGADGEYLYQCDLRHLLNRSQANACLKPKLEASILDLPFANRAHNEKWHLVKISNEHENAIETIAIAATSTRIVIMKYDLTLQRFKPIRALDTATSVSSILFTLYTAIVGSDKFFEIDLNNFTAEEFIDLSDSTLSHTRNSNPVTAFRISSQEFLLCFTECAIFVDEYGCRSRPYDISWQYTPTGFMYCAPFLYISHFQIFQIIRIHRSFQNEVSNTMQSIEDSSDDDSNEPKFKRIFLNLYMSTILTESGKNNCLVLAIDKETGKQEIYSLNGVKAMKNILNISMETVSSEATCVTIESESSSAL